MTPQAVELLRLSKEHARLALTIDRVTPPVPPHPADTPLEHLGKAVLLTIKVPAMAALFVWWRSRRGAAQAFRE
jgi:hypothetical protein